MPHVTHWEDRGIHWRFTGVVSEDELTQAGAEMWGDQRFDELRYFIWDATNVEKLDFDVEVDIEAAIGKGSSNYKPMLKGALVSKNDDVRSIMERYIATSSMLNSPWDIRLFNNLEDARNWISPS